MTSPEIYDRTEMLPPDNGHPGSSETPKRQQERATSTNCTSFLTPSSTRPPLPHPHSAPQPSTGGLDVAYPDLSAFSNPDHGRSTSQESNSYVKNLWPPSSDFDQLSTTQSIIDLPSNCGHTRAILESPALTLTAPDVEETDPDESYYSLKQPRARRPHVRNDSLRNVSPVQTNHIVPNPGPGMTNSMARDVGSEGSSYFQFSLQGSGHSPPESPMELSHQIRKTRSQTRNEALSTRAKSATDLQRSTSMPERRLEYCQHNGGEGGTEASGPRIFHEDKRLTENRANSRSVHISIGPIPWSRIQFQRHAKL